MPPPEASRRFSFFGVGGGARGRDTKKNDLLLPPPSLKLQTDKNVYRPGDPVIITIEIQNPSDSWSLLVERLSFETKGIEKLDTQWFATQKPSSTESKHKRGEYVFMDCSTPSIVSNQILSSGTSRTYVVRVLLPSIIPPSYRGSTVRYLYYVKSTLSGHYLILENGQPHGESIRNIAELEFRIPLQIWVTQKTNGLLVEEGGTDGIVPLMTIMLDVYWKEMDADSDWARANETFDGVEEGYESSRDEISSVSSYNPTRGSIQKNFGSSVSLQSSVARSNKDVHYLESRNSISSYMALPRLSVAEVLYDSSGDALSPQKSSAIVSPSQQLKHVKSLSLEDDLRVPSVPRTVEPIA